MSAPLVWTMINQHTTTVPLQLGIPAAYAFALPLVVILVAWHLVWQLYRRAGEGQGVLGTSRPSRAPPRTRPGNETCKLDRRRVRA